MSIFGYRRTKLDSIRSMLGDKDYELWYKTLMDCKSNYDISEFISYGEFVSKSKYLWEFDYIYFYNIAYNDKFSTTLSKEERKRAVSLFIEEQKKMESSSSMKSVDPHNDMSFYLIAVNIYFPDDITEMTDCFYSSNGYFFVMRNSKAWRIKIFDKGTKLSRIQVFENNLVPDLLFIAFKRDNIRISDCIIIDLSNGNACGEISINKSRQRVFKLDTEFISESSFKMSQLFN